MATFERDGEVDLVGQHKKNRQAARGGAGGRRAEAESHFPIRVRETFKLN